MQQLLQPQSREAGEVTFHSLSQKHRSAFTQPRRMRSLALFDPHLYLFIGLFVSFFIAKIPAMFMGSAGAQAKLDVAWVLCCLLCNQFGWELCNLRMGHCHLSPSYCTWMQSSEYPQGHFNSSPQFSGYKEHCPQILTGEYQQLNLSWWAG